MTTITAGNLLKFATKTLSVTLASNGGTPPAETVLFTNEVEIVGMTIANSGSPSGAFMAGVRFKDQDGTVLARYSTGSGSTLVISAPALWNFTSLSATTIEGNAIASVNETWLTIYYRDK